MQGLEIKIKENLTSKLAVSDRNNSLKWKRTISLTSDLHKLVSMMTKVTDPGFQGQAQKETVKCLSQAEEMTG